MTHHMHYVLYIGRHRMTHHMHYSARDTLGLIVLSLVERLSLSQR